MNYVNFMVPPPTSFETWFIIRGLCQLVMMSSMGAVLIRGESWCFHPPGRCQ